MLWRAATRQWAHRTSGPSFAGYVPKRRRSAMDKYALIVEEFACWGCKTCEVACKQEYNAVEAKEGVKYLSVWPDGPKLVKGKLDFVWRVSVCKHCDDPACARAC